MTKFTPGIDPMKYFFHIFLGTGLLIATISSIANKNIWLGVVLLFAFCAVIYPLTSLLKQKITITDSRLDFYKKDLMKDASVTIDLNKVKSAKLLTYKGKNDFKERHAIEFFEAVNDDEPKLYNEKQKRINLELWDNANVKALIDFLQQNYGNIIWK